MVHRGKRSRRHIGRLERIRQRREVVPRRGTRVFSHRIGEEIAWLFCGFLLRRNGFRLPGKTALSRRAIDEINDWVKSDPGCCSLIQNSPFAWDFGGFLRQSLAEMFEVFIALMAEGRTWPPTFGEFIDKAHEMCHLEQDDGSEGNTHAK